MSISESDGGGHSRFYRLISRLWARSVARIRRGRGTLGLHKDTIFIDGRKRGGPLGSLGGKAYQIPLMQSHHTSYQWGGGGGEGSNGQSLTGLFLSRGIKNLKSF
jgi:hypothetical protein